ncbi:putative bcl-2-like protein 1 [Triplophysa rosa]|uniref:Bcl-2-like protein 1 n=1 Tax=Triplophysa rosa TaxID=992332 RepID=A0A9W7TUX0_TRIRA|nr:putative bcl-2-like protein 1 [Triplophysa rosa]
MRDEVQRQGACVQPLPEPQPLNDEQEQLLGQMAEVIRFIGDGLDRDPKFNNMVDGFARVADRKSFQKLVDHVFVDDITWGRIVTLICLVAKSIVKMLTVVSRIVSWTLDYFNDRLLHWICNHGGWVNSISSLACYSFERDAASSASLISPASGLFFISGLLLGGYIVWRMNRCA